MGNKLILTRFKQKCYPKYFPFSRKKWSEWSMFTAMLLNLIQTWVRATKLFDFSAKNTLTFSYLGKLTLLKSRLQGSSIEYGWTNGIDFFPRIPAGIWIKKEYYWGFYLFEKLSPEDELYHTWDFNPNSPSFRSKIKRSSRPSQVKPSPFSYNPESEAKRWRGYTDFALRFKIAFCG